MLGETEPTLLCSPKRGVLKRLKHSPLSAIQQDTYQLIIGLISSLK